ncbi:MAG: hypothetical protein ACOYBE_00360 [Blautia sp.]|jgi:hypothetical protein
MKVRAQDGSQVLEYGEAFVEYTKDGYAGVYVKSLYSRNGALAGRYEDKARCCGVLVDMLHAYKNGERVFYMPIE